MDPLYHSLSLFRKKKYDQTIEICTKMLERNQLDQAVWYLKTKALTEKTYIDDTEMEDDGVADILLDDNAVALLPRPGTSLMRPATGSGGASSRPLTNGGRPISGFARPGTVNRPGTSVELAFQGSRPNTSRPVTSSGRYVRVGTASMISEPGGPFINVEKISLKKYATRPPLAKVLLEYLLYHDNNPKKALELASLATQHADFKDWWWKCQLGKCYYKLGLLRDAEKQFISSMKNQDMVNSNLWLAKVYMRLDQPNSALEQYSKAAENFAGEVSLIIGVGRLYEMMNDTTKSVQFYKRVLHFDSANVEAIASLAASHFYSDSPELALRYYRRLLQMGINSAEIWNNLGLCCFYSQQYDMALSCFERALTMATDETVADVWYNVGQVAIGIGDLGLAYQAFKIAVSLDTNHAEAFNNLGVLELRKNNPEQAKSNFQTSCSLAPWLSEPLFNEALFAYKIGDLQESYKLVSQVLQLYPDHEDAKDLSSLLQGMFFS